MSYERLPLNYAIPNGSGVLAADVLTSAAVHGEYLMVRKVDMNRLYVAITTAVVSNVNVAVAFKKRSAAGVTSGEVTVGTVLIPTGASVGQVYYKDIDPAEFLPGQTLALEVTVAAAGGGAAGGALYSFECQDSPEQPANISSMVASA